MGYLTIDLECSECLRDLEFTQNKQVLTVKPCSCKMERLENEVKAQDLFIQAQQQLLAAYQEKITI